MLKNPILFSVGMLLLAISQTTLGQPTFKYGLGGGVNFSNVMTINSYALFEDITGEDYTSQYSNMFSNLGSQYFFHGEMELQLLTIAVKPGIYSYNFSKTDQIIFSSETYEQVNHYKLRYLQIPVEAKLTFGTGNIRPFAGGSVAYGQLLYQPGGNNSFIGPRITLAPVVGSYFTVAGTDLVLTAGYNFGMHPITKKSDRYNVEGSTPYSQSDITVNDLFITLSVLFSLEREESKGGLDCPTPNQRQGKTKKHKSGKRN